MTLQHESLAIDRDIKSLGQVLDLDRRDEF